MSDSLPPYPEYKDSGVEWLGKIPSHWEIRKVKYIFYERVEKGHENEPLLVASQKHGVIRKDLYGTRTMTALKDLHLLKFVEVGDFVISLRSFEGGIEIAHHKGIISPAYTILAPNNKNNTGYLRHFLKSSLFIEALKLFVTGIREGQNINYTSLSRSFLPLPHPDEQAEIVRFLDAAETRIRRYIRAKQKLIKLLNEQKQAIIQQAVTRGLNPDVPMKDSGVEWLGEIPEHWEMRRVRTLVKRIEQGISPDSSSYLANENSWGVLKSGCANRGIFRETEHKRLPDSFPIDPKIIVHVGDVIISRASGSPALVGSTARVYHLNYNLILSDKTFRPVFQQPLLTDFIVYSMNTRYYRIQVEQGISGAEGLANNLPVSELKDFRLAIPPIREAEEIVEYLNKELPVIDYLMNEAQSQVDLIQEYRICLIADVVTGKVDVRGLEFELPEEFDESDLLEADEDEILEEDDFEEVDDE